MNDIDRRSGSSALAPAVVITGATEGIGRALAEEFAQTGHSLLLVARDDTALARAADELSSAHGVTVKVAAQDLSTAEGCAGVEQTLRRFGLTRRSVSRQRRYFSIGKRCPVGRGMV